MKRGFDALTMSIVFAGGTLAFLCTAFAVDKHRDAKPLVKSSFRPNKTFVDSQASRDSAQFKSFSRQTPGFEPSDNDVVRISDTGADPTTNTEPASGDRPSTRVIHGRTPAVKPVVYASGAATTTNMRVITQPIPTKALTLDARYERLKISLPDEEPDVLIPVEDTNAEHAPANDNSMALQPAKLSTGLMEPGTPEVPTEINNEEISNEPSVDLEAAAGGSRFAYQADAAGVNEDVLQPTLAVEPQQPESGKEMKEDAPNRKIESNGAQRSVRPVNSRYASSGANNRDQGVDLEWKVPNEVSTDAEADCQLMIRNTSDSPAYGITVYVELPQTVKLGKATENHRIDGPQIIWDFAEIEARGHRIIHVGMIPQSSGSIAPRAAVTFTRISTASFSVLESRIHVSIEGPDEMVAGQMANYSLLISNLGTGSATDVSVKVHLDEKLRHSEGTDLEYLLGTIPAGEMRRVQVPLLAATGGACPISTSAISHGEVRSEVEHIVQIVEPKLELAVQGPRIRYVDRKANYIITVHNPGPAVVNNVQVFDTVPSGFRFDSATNGGTYDRAAKQVAWFIGRLEPEQTAEVAVKLIATEMGTQPISTIVKADAGVLQEAQTTTFIEGIASVVMEVVDEDDPVEVLGETSYQIRITNQGSKTAKNVQVAASLPKEMELLDTDGPTDASIGNQRIVFDPISSLEPNATVVFRVRARCLEAGHVAFRAFFRTSESPQTVNQEELTRIYAD